MNIESIIADELKTSYVNRVERSLNNRGLTFTDLKNYIRVGSSTYGITDAAFDSYFGDDTDIPIHKRHCICEHEILLCSIISKHKNIPHVLSNIR